MSRYTARAQWDAIGIVFIVIILAFGMLYMVYQQKTSNVDTKEDAIDSQLSQSMLNSIMESTTDCNSDMSKLIDDCYGRNDLCGVDTCVHAYDKLKEILDGSLGKWKRHYRLFVEKEDIRKIEISSNCSRFDEKASSGLFFIPQLSGTIVVTLDICKI